MRYLIAMICGVAVAVLFTLFVSSPLASWIVARQTFESPDAVNDLHAFLFLATNLAGLVAGWTFGWWLGGRFEKPVDMT